MPEGGQITVLVRLAEHSDSPHCANIFLDGRREAFPWRRPELFHWHDYFECVLEEEVWVAEADGQVVGFVSASLPDRTICNLFIASGWRCRGIGRQLLDCALNHLGGMVRLRCASRNLGARRFYQRNGWIEEENGPGGDGDFVVCRLNRGPGWRWLD